jgi:hypothetical protein
MVFCPRYPWETDAAPAEPPSLPPADRSVPKRRGRRPRVTTPAAVAVSPVWLYHHLTVGGPGDMIEDFATAARGSGVIPWRLDFDVIEEDIFNLAATQPASRRNLTITGCRILARQFRARVEARQARAAALVGRSRMCPFDLHTLLPVPAAILQFGPIHGDALAWLAEHWGTQDGLRQVVERPKPPTGRRLPAGHGVVSYGFFTAGETPQAAITRIGARWPALNFVLQPRPSD